MSERYSKLYSLPENLYIKGSPIVIVAGALLKDNYTEKVVAQLKLCNISAKNIKSATVSIFPLNTAGKPLGKPVRYEYLDLCIPRDMYFGSNFAIPLPNASSRSFGVAVDDVVFADNSLWSANGDHWTSLNKPEELAPRLDKEMVKQFRMKYGEDAENFLLEQADLWYCVCGAINRQDEKTCHSCRKSIDDLESIDLDVLRSQKEHRLAQEQQQAEKEAAVAQEKGRKVKKAVSIALSSAAIVIAFFALLHFAVIPNGKYNNAVSIMEAGNYENAIAAFEEIEGYKDSASKILESKYAIAVDLMKGEKYEEAITAFEKIDGYKDCKERSKLCSYYIAEKLYADRNYLEAQKIFSRLDLFDSKEMVQQCSDDILSGYLKFTGLFRCDEGYSISVNASFSNGKITIYGVNTSYIEGSD